MKLLIATLIAKIQSNTYLAINCDKGRTFTSLAMFDHIVFCSPFTRLHFKMKQARKQTLISFETTPRVSESNLPSGHLCQTDPNSKLWLGCVLPLAIFYLQFRIVATTNQTLDLDVQFVPTGPFQI